MTRNSAEVQRAAAFAFPCLAENVRDYAVFLVDADGIITFWGEGARLMKWWTREEAEGAHLRLLYPSGGSEDGTAEDHIRAAVERGEYSGEGQRVRRDGSTFWAGVTLTALRDSSGKLLGFAKVARDLTARRAATEALSAATMANDARERAEGESRMQREHLANMSHELRTPLGAIQGYVDLLCLESAGRLTPKQREYLRRINVAGEHLLGLISEVLDFSRLAAGGLSVARDFSRTGVAIDAALVLIQPQAAAKGLVISNEVSRSAAETPYLGDEGRVRQILINILGNATKFTPTGGEIRVSAGSAHTPLSGAKTKGRGPWIYIRVEDNGPGIPEDRLEAVFEPFKQASAGVAQKYGGTGLGLAISRRLARLMGGDLTVESEVGHGSTFILTLPAARTSPELADLSAKPQGDHPRPQIRDEIASAILADGDVILTSFLQRLRADPAIPSAKKMSDEDLVDHMAIFISDVAETLRSAEFDDSAEPRLASDDIAIRDLIGTRHGLQRFMWGWSMDEIRREFAILRDEIVTTVRRHVTKDREKEEQAAIQGLISLLEIAERSSLAGYEAGAGRA